MDQMKDEAGFVRSLSRLRRMSEFDCPLVIMEAELAIAIRRFGIVRVLRKALRQEIEIWRIKRSISRSTKIACRLAD